MSQPQATSQTTSVAEETASFGFTTVAAEAKAGMVREVFDSVASRYDLMNDLMSGGVHRLWKAALVEWLSPRGAMTHLDVAGGTGDVAERIARRAPEATVVVADINPTMLGVGRERAAKRGLDGRFVHVACDAEALALPDRSVDAYTIAFGLRNVTRIDQAIAEAYRVLKPGGRFLCLEFSHVAVPGLDKLYDAYSFKVLPTLGAKVAGDRDAYRYLVESIRKFPPQDELAARIAAVGFGQVTYRNLSAGIAAIHSGWRL